MKKKLHLIIFLTVFGNSFAQNKTIDYKPGDLITVFYETDEFNELSADRTISLLSTDTKSKIVEYEFEIYNSSPNEIIVKEFDLLCGCLIKKDFQPNTPLKNKQSLKFKIKYAVRPGKAYFGKLEVLANGKLTKRRFRFGILSK